MGNIIYRAVFPNGKSYIGITRQSLGSRISQHIYKARKDLKPNKVQNAINKYGADSIIWEILETTDTYTELLDREVEWIRIFNSQIDGYNTTPGGLEAATCQLEVKEKLRKNHHKCWIGRKHTEETKEKMRRNNKRATLGMKMPDHIKLVKSIRMRGENNPMYGRKHSKETIEKLKEINKDNKFFLGHKHSLESKLKISNKLKGRKLSLLHREKLRVAHRALKKPGKPVEQLDKNMKLLNKFESIKAAARFLRETTPYRVPNGTEIKFACLNPEYARYGYYWRFVV